MISSVPHNEGSGNTGTGTRRFLKFHVNGFYATSRLSIAKHWRDVVGDLSSKPIPRFHLCQSSTESIQSQYSRKRKNFMIIQGVMIGSIVVRGEGKSTLTPGQRWQNWMQTSLQRGAILIYVGGIHLIAGRAKHSSRVCPLPTSRVCSIV